MKNSYNPSVNIVRDDNKVINYITTENANKAAIKIQDDFKKGIHSFTIIGSYGTGKSAFIRAFQETLKRNNILFDLNSLNKFKKVETINLVGGYCSLIDVFNDYLDIKSDYSSYQNLFQAIYEQYENLGANSLLLITIDEFGKHLEFAANNNPEKEMYFIQQFAEFINDSDRNIMLLTTLHQGLDAYAYKLSDSQKNEWKKVKGRLQEITFNEPVEQLLSLASKHFTNYFGSTKETKHSKLLVKLQQQNRVFSAQDLYFKELKNTLYPLDIFSAYTLTLALQKYGQNERSLFSFLYASEELGINDKSRKIEQFALPSVYDYLSNNFYQFLNTKVNPDYSNWSGIKNALQRIEVLNTINLKVAESIIKAIGLLSIFSSKGAKIDDSFLVSYFSNSFNKSQIVETLKILVKKQIIRYSKFNFSYKLFEGTDLDIEAALINAEKQVAELVDLVPKLNTYFQFPIITAKSNSYKTGTPRLFEYVLSETPVSKKPLGAIDGFINLIFNVNSDSQEVREITKEENHAILYGFFKNSELISSALYDIEKTKQVLKNLEDDGDNIAKKELQSILKSNSNLLNHYVLDALFDENKVDWIFKGQPISIKNMKALNQMLSKICDEVYYKTPRLNNELFNRHKVSSSISTARKNYFRALVNNFETADLGFDANKLPPEKTIYYTLLKNSGIHKASDNTFSLTKPMEQSEVYILWKECEKFLSEAKDERKSISELVDKLSNAPSKLKQGVIDFWIPTFLFIRKGDYALYDEGKFKPYINEQQLHLITRVPQRFQIKSFELSDLRLSFFNKYRELLQQNDSKELNVKSFIESIRPILIMYRDLTPYSQNTNRISKEAIDLRTAIRYAQDPEKVFFDEFPKALGFDTSELLNSHQNFDDYIYKFQNAIDEIKDAYSQLLNRIEKFITVEILSRKLDFLEYKKALSNRFSSLKEHQLINKQKSFVQRINSPLNDRDSWIASIGQVLIGKPLNSINDKDEATLKDNFLHIVKELDNLSALEQLNFDENKEEVYKLDFTTKQKGLTPFTVRIAKNKLVKAEKQMNNIQKELANNNKQTKIAILAKLLRDELENE